MTLGKHNVRARLLAEKIALALGNAIVAPVIAYTPEGSVNPPTGHMRFPGTLSISDAAFEATLESAGRSLKLAGFRDIVFLGDHGGYQKNLQIAATRLNGEWKATGTRAHGIIEYYSTFQAAFVQALKERGYSDSEIGSHAGLADTSLALAVDPHLVRSERLHSGAKLTPADGVHGDPARASAELGKIGVDAIVAGASMQSASHRSALISSAVNSIHLRCSRPNLRNGRNLATPAACMFKRYSVGIASSSAAQKLCPLQLEAVTNTIATIPGMPAVTDPANLYSEIAADKMSPAVAGDPKRVYVPNLQSNDVYVIDQETLTVIDKFRVGLNPQHVVPSWDMRTLWVANNAENTKVGGVTPVDPRTRRQGGSVEDPTTCTSRRMASQPSSLQRPSSASTSAIRRRWRCSPRSMFRAAPASTTPIFRSTGDLPSSPVSSAAWWRKSISSTGKCWATSSS